MRREVLRRFLRHKADSIGCDFACADKYVEKLVDRINSYGLQDIADLVDRAHFEAAKRRGKTQKNGKFFCSNFLSNLIRYSGDRCGRRSFRDTRNRRGRRVGRIRAVIAARNRFA